MGRERERENGGREGEPEKESQRTDSEKDRWFS